MAIVIESFRNVTHVKINNKEWINVYPPYDFIDEFYPAKVNWCAIGESTPEITREFAEGLKQAADIADRLNEEFKNKKKN